MRLICLLMLRAYKRLISPMLPASCKYTPTCSEFAMEAVDRHGVLYGGMLALWRVLRCNPFAKGGYDPVSAHICEERADMGHRSVKFISLGH